MDLFVDRKYLIGLVLAGLCSGAMIALAHYTTGQLRGSLESTRHTQDIIVRLERISTDLAELETGQRGYLLTGDEPYLQPYLTASARLDDDLAALTALISDNKLETQRLAALGGVVRQKRAELARSIELHKTQGLAAALALVRTGEGQKYMEALRGALGEMAREQNRLLLIRKEQEQRDTRTSTMAASLMGLLTALLLLLTYALMRREVKGRAEVEGTLVDANALLAVRVRERTQALQDSNAALEQEIGARGSAEAALGQSRHELAEAVLDLHRSEARLRGIIAKASDAIVTVDETQHILLANPAAEQMFGWPPGEMLGAPLGQFIPARFRATHRAHIEHFGATGATQRRMGGQSILFGLRANGEEFRIEASISQLIERDSKVYTVILRDVTERLRIQGALDRSQKELSQAVAALVRSEGRLSGIIATASDAIITVDETQHIILVNSVAETVFRCRPGEMVGLPLARFIPQRHRAAHRGYIKRFGATGATARTMGGQSILSGLRADGEEFPIEASISQLAEERGRLYTVILRDITERKRMQDALEYSHRELQELSSALQSIREEERKRIARELHDDLGQLLAALRMDLSVLKGRLAPGHPDLSAMADQMDQLVLTTVVSLRRIAADLRPKILDDIGLYPALQSLVGEFSQRQGIACKLSAFDDDLPLDETRATSLFRMTQEALNNVAKHAGATMVTVAIQRNGDDLVLTVRDDGRGMSADDRRKSKSYGLIGMRERAYILGGDFAIESELGAGTTIRISLRLPAEGAN
jgi:PAS domain S-box-containing protein